MIRFLLIALALVLPVGMTQAGIWNLADDFYTSAQHLPWYYGAWNQPANYFALFDGQSNVGNGNPEGTFAGWLSYGEGWDAYGSLGKNLGPGPCSIYGFYTEEGDVRIQGVNKPDWVPGALWRAEEAGQYQVTVRFTGTWYSDHYPETSPMNVYLKQGVPGAYADVTTGALDGYIGSAAANFTDGWGNVREFNYSSIVTLAAGEDLLFLAGGTGSYGHSAGLDVTITSVPEPASIFLVASGIVGLAACRWRKRK